MKEKSCLSIICRICLQSSEEQMTSLLASDGTYCIYEQIEKCANIKITNDPDKPMRICSKCKVFLSFAFKFYIMCQNSQNYLDEFGLQSTVQDEEVDIEDVEFLESHELDETRYEYLDDKIWFQTQDDQIIELDQIMKLESKQKKIEEVKQPKNTLDISSDGAAVIRVKKTNKARTKNQAHVCEICGNVYKKNYMLGNVSHHRSRDRSYRTHRYVPETHMRHHHLNEKNFECEICGGKYTYNYQLRRHMNKHSGKRPFSCSYCKRTFTDNSTMRKHERLHRNERPYKCDVCQKTFTYSSVLKAHQQIHTGQKPYSCGICGKRFSRGHHLRNHLETQKHAKDPRIETLLKHIRPDEIPLTEI